MCDGDESQAQQPKEQQAAAPAKLRRVKSKIQESKRRQHLQLLANHGATMSRSSISRFHSSTSLSRSLILVALVLMSAATACMAAVSAAEQQDASCPGDASVARQDTVMQLVDEIKNLRREVQELKQSAAKAQSGRIIGGAVCRDILLTKREIDVVGEGVSCERITHGTFLGSEGPDYGKCPAGSRRLFTTRPGDIRTFLCVTE